MPGWMQGMRLVIKDSKKHVGEKLVMAFVEYSNTYFATEAMDALQVGGRAGRWAAGWGMEALRAMWAHLLAMSGELRAPCCQLA